MNKISVIFSIAIICFACEGEYSHQKSAKSGRKSIHPVANIDDVAKSAVELYEERLYFVTLEFKKEQFTLDITEHLGNAISAEQKTIMVGEDSFDDFRVGKNVSEVNDTWGLILDGDLSRYVVRTVSKEVETRYFWVDKNNKKVEILASDYANILQKLNKSGATVVTVPFAGTTRNYLLEKPLSAFKIVSTEPLKRYYVTIQVKNASFSLSIGKHLRNNANKHNITIEVPADVYRKTGEVWTPELNDGSLVFKGRFSQLHGDVVKKREKVDHEFVFVKTAEGRTFIVPKKLL